MRPRHYMWYEGQTLVKFINGNFSGLVYQINDQGYMYRTLSIQALICMGSSFFVNFVGPYPL